MAFTRLFCSKRWFGGWKTQQDRSYFGVKLPGGWWLVGVDVQLHSDIDRAQIEYFKEIAAEMGQEDRVILCCPEPQWIYTGIYGSRDPNYSENNLRFFERKVLGFRIAVFIAGDLNHYRRHASDANVQRITAGGGGAFLHPTHGPDVSQLPEGFQLKSCFPPEQESRRLSWGNLFFPFRNLKFGFLPAFLYLLTAWAVGENMGLFGIAEIGGIGIRDIGAAVQCVFNSALSSSVASFWVLVIFLGFLLFTDTHVRWYRLVIGTLHGVTHLVATFFIHWGAAYYAVSYLGLSPKSIGHLLTSGVVIFVLGGFVGSLIIGLYLLMSLNVFDRHQNEAFSALRIPDWKCFLRIKVEGNGKLTIFPIGIRRVPREWKTPTIASGPELIADDPRATKPELIEEPIVVKRS